MADDTTSTDTTAASAATDKIGPLADKAKAFAKDRPFATAALLGVVGMALLNTLRGKGRTS